MNGVDKAVLWFIGLIVFYSLADKLIELAFKQSETSAFKCGSIEIYEQK